jgi:hypothetical protein
MNALEMDTMNKDSQRIKSLGINNWLVDIHEAPHSAFLPGLSCVRDTLG